MDLVERLRVAAAGAPSDRRGRPVRLTVLPACSAAEIAALQAQYDVPLPAELTSLLAATRGVAGLPDLDLVLDGSLAGGVELAELMPAPLPVAADRAGNFWVLDLTPDTTEAAPVFFACHDPAVLLYQAPDLATFLDEVLQRLSPPHRSVLDDVRDDRLFDVWGSRPGALGQPAALRAPDLALREFATTLDPAWTVVDLRQRQVGMGVAWGRHGPRTRLARHGWERIFGYAPHAEPKRTWRRVFRKPRV